MSQPVKQLKELAFQVDCDVILMLDVWRIVTPPPLDVVFLFGVLGTWVNLGSVRVSVRAPMIWSSSRISHNRDSVNRSHA